MNDSVEWTVGVPSSSNTINLGNRTSKVLRIIEQHIHECVGPLCSQSEGHTS